MSKIDAKFKKKMKSLAGEAGYNGLIYEISQEGLDKLAKLIIIECAVIANKAETNENELRCMYDVITEHFGVE